MPSPVSPIEDEFKNIVLPDERLKKRAQSMLKSLSQSPDKTLPASFRGRAELKAAYRFFDQNCVDPETILSPHIEKTIERINQQNVVLLVNDSTEINMGHMTEVNNLGVTNNKDYPGCILHLLKAFTPERLPLGVVSATFMKRSYEGFGGNRKKRGNIKEKESYRWLEDYRKACEIAKQSSAHIVYVADRESDIYELFCEANNNAADILIRGNYKRGILQEDQSKDQLLPAIKRKAPIGALKFSIPEIKERKRRDKREKKKRATREVTQEIRAVSVTLHPPKHKRHLPPAKINALYLEEINVPKGEEGINWLLFTTLEINTKEDAEKAVDFYLARWGIETFFHVLKTGCKIEDLQFKDSDRLLPCIGMYLIVAWRLMYLTMLGRIEPEASCCIMFEEDEWECAYAIVKKKPPPKLAPTLGEMIQLVANMGGYLGRKSDGPPGPKVMWIGLQKLYFNAEGWSMHKNLIASSKTYG